MLFWFRAHASRIAITAMLSLATLGASAVTPHVDDCHESACLTMAVEHDADAHRFTAPPTDTDTHHLHCLVCHWVRSFRPHITTKFVAAPAVLVRAFDHFDRITVARNAQVAQPPLRSPPVPPTA